MTPEQQETKLEALIKNSQLIQNKMAELTEILEKNLGMIDTLIHGFSPAQASAAANGIPLTSAEHSIAIAVATLAAQGIHIIPRQWLAIVARISPKSSKYRAGLASLLKRRMLIKAADGEVRATETLAASADAPVDWTEVMHRFAGLMPSKEAAILQLLSSNRDGLQRKTLGEYLGQSAESSSFRQRLTQLEADGFIVYGPESTVRANIDWFQKVKP